jgi:hypothetical protein
VKQNAQSGGTPVSRQAVPEDRRAPYWSNGARGGQRLLVVDDEIDIADLLTTGLRFVGFDVRAAHSGAEALAVAAEFPPHLLVLDVTDHNRLTKTTHADVRMGIPLLVRRKTVVRPAGRERRWIGASSVLFSSRSFGTLRRVAFATIGRWQTV